MQHCVTVAMCFADAVLSWAQRFSFTHQRRQSMATLEEVCMQRWEVGNCLSVVPIVCVSVCLSVCLWVELLCSIGCSGKLWIKQMLLSSLLLPVLVCGTAFFINFIAIGYHASRAIPFSSMVRCAALKLSFVYILSLLGVLSWLMQDSLVQDLLRYSNQVLHLADVLISMSTKDTQFVPSYCWAGECWGRSFHDSPVQIAIHTYTNCCLQ